MQLACFPQGRPEEHAEAEDAARVAILVVTVAAERRAKGEGQANTEEKRKAE